MIKGDQMTTDLVGGLITMVSDQGTSVGGPRTSVGGPRTMRSAVLIRLPVTPKNEALTLIVS